MRSGFCFDIISLLYLPGNYTANQILKLKTIKLMVLQTKIDFDNIYEIIPVDRNLKKSFFKTELVDGTQPKIHIMVSSQSHDLFPNVYNLAFGPSNPKGGIDDKAAIMHKNYSKVFSTILFEARNYLLRNPDHLLGIDGSNNVRAYLYYRFIQRNYAYLNNYFDVYGVKYFVRIARLGKTQYDDPFDFEDICSDVQKLEKNMETNLKFMYNYFIFKLK